MSALASGLEKLPAWMRRRQLVYRTMHPARRAHILRRATIELDRITYDGQVHWTAEARARINDDNVWAAMFDLQAGRRRTGVVSLPRPLLAACKSEDCSHRTRRTMPRARGRRSTSTRRRRSTARDDDSGSDGPGRAGLALLLAGVTS